MFLNLEENIIETQMYISYAIAAMSLLTIIMMKIKLPNLDIIFFMRLILTIGLGFVLYIPTISMLMDIFICREEANGYVYFDVDCTTECWTNDHISYLIAASFAILIIIPTGFYLRIKF